MAGSAARPDEEVLDGPYRISALNLVLALALGFELASPIQMGSIGGTAGIRPRRSAIA